MPNFPKQKYPLQNLENFKCKECNERIEAQNVNAHLCPHLDLPGTFTIFRTDEDGVLHSASLGAEEAR